MEMTSYDMERPAVMPTAAPVGAVTLGDHLAAADPHQVHGTFAPLGGFHVGTSGKPWTTGYDRQIGRRGRGMNGRPARHLGRAST